MKKVMERLQEENESLKKSAAPRVTTLPHTQALKIAYCLQKNVEALKPKEADHVEPTSPLKQLEKLSKENDRLRKDLKKVMYCTYALIHTSCRRSITVKIFSLRLVDYKWRITNSKMRCRG